MARKQRFDPVSEQWYEHEEPSTPARGPALTRADVNLIALGVAKGLALWTLACALIGFLFMLLRWAL